MITPRRQIKVAVYARYSSDMQSSASIADQVRICRKLAEDHGWEVVEVFKDEGLSGTTHLRPGFQEMQQAAMARRFDILVSEALDRISRDQEHIAGLHKRLGFVGVAIFTKAEGEISEMHVGLGGTMNALFVRNLAAKTHRGLEGRVRLGKSAGGISFGYRVDRQLRPDGTQSAGDRVVDELEAAIVRRIFREFDQGLSARSIAIGLNRDGIAPPRSGGKGKGNWSFSTISGNWRRGTGILNNELYVGKLVWNRQHFVKDPDSGKRQARPNPPELWIVEEVPHLRIIDDALWARVKRRQGAIRQDILTERADANDAPRVERGHRPRYLLSGLLHCGCCGSGYIMISASRYGCAAARNSGTCSNRKTIARDAVEKRVLNGLQSRLMHPDLIREYIITCQQEIQRERSDTLAARSEHERRHARVVWEIENIVTAISKGMFYESMKAKMDALETERVDLEAKLVALPEPEPVILHPGLADIYARKVADLATALNDRDGRQEAAALLRRLIETVILTPDPGQPDDHRIELVDELGAILSLCDDGEGGNAKARRSSAVTCSPETSALWG